MTIFASRVMPAPPNWLSKVASGFSPDPFVQYALCKTLMAPGMWDVPYPEVRASTIMILPVLLAPVATAPALMLDCTESAVTRSAPFGNSVEAAVRVAPPPALVPVELPHPASDITTASARNKWKNLFFMLLPP